MAIQYSVAVNNARLDSVESTTGTAPLLRIFSGSAPANCAAADSGTLLCTITLPSDWMNAAASASKTLLGTWSNTASAGSATTPTHFRIWNSGATTCHIQGTCGIGSGDLQVNGTITSGQTVTVTSFTLNAANT
jgi:hypothetical protein